MDSRERGLTRRQFVAGAAVTIGAAAGAGALRTARASAAPVADAPETEKRKADETVDTQVVVVGSGLGGLSAALTAMEEGASRVVLLEKNAIYGGDTNFAEANGPGQASDAQARAAAAAALKASNYIADPMLHYWLNIEKKENTDWLFKKHGVKYTQKHGGPAFYEGGNGMSCVKTLVGQAKTMGIDLRLSTPALALLLKDPYTCVGIRAKSAGGKLIDFKAKAVVLATGGMSTNKKRLAQYTSIDLEKVLIDGIPTGQDGDGHKMVEETAHGRATHLCVTSLFINVKGFAYSSPMGVCAGMQPTNLWVNQDGIRFVDESVVRNTAGCNNVVEIQGNVYSIMDRKGFERYAAGGCQSHYSGFADKLVGTPIPDLDKEFERYKHLKDVFYAENLGGLARQMGIDAAVFKATVARYNGYAASGKDAEWGKDVSNIWPIATAPFYGFRLYSGMLNTNGGVRINTNAQVVDARYKVISGLYATGILTSGWCGETYIGGICQPVALWGGRKAAKHIASHLL